MASPSSNIYYYQVYFNSPLERPFTYSSKYPNLRYCRVLVQLRNRQAIGLVYDMISHPPPVVIKEIEWVIDDIPVISPTQARLAEWISRQYLSSLGESLALFCSFSYKKKKGDEEQKSNENREVKKNIRISEKRDISKTFESKIKLSENQEKNFVKISDQLSHFNPIMIFGVTGSGKTFFYLKIVEKILFQGRQALILVPEISLIFQIHDQCKGIFDRFKVGIYHSKLTINEREELRREVREHTVDLVIATRSGLFLPFEDLGSIVIDEEHENSYKNNSNPRYQTKQVAYHWAQVNDIPIFFVSATPTVEMFYQTETNIMKMIELNERYSQAQLPQVDFIARENQEGISTTVYKEVFTRLEKKKQVLFYINQRGFSSTVMCANCKNYYKCPNCEITLTYHKKKKILTCHYCGFQEEYKPQCSQCGEEDLVFIKAGTEKVYEELENRFQNYKVVRFDSDSITNPKKIQETLIDFKEGKIDVLVGTQMIIKGHDFKNIALVVVLAPEKYLLLPDYRSNERMFAHLMQVSGRAGRERQGESIGKMIVETDIENHFSLQATKKQSYLEFYRQEIKYRKIFNYPPFCKLVRLVLRGKKEEQVIKTSHDVKRKLNDIFSNGIVILGPSPCLLEKYNHYYRWNIVIKVKRINEFLDKVRGVLLNCNKKNVYLEIDVSPVDLF